ncbi:hypothetical protein HELRODRAFT_171144 [Helobdella robusta]|uniref:Uncharacterized protein n=1 Tax=Helobdella robusta TaxID=6412 RepID=T1F3U8_HELRO|nr:hypothetical protein HELRODRAFT_171144 [Helobdella robusta]ESO05506.1 hypothetical protein HELRODRAFT_171144 [Helobdella robusta]
MATSTLINVTTATTILSAATTTILAATTTTSATTTTTSEATTTTSAATTTTSAATTTTLAATTTTSAATTTTSAATTTTSASTTTTTLPAACLPRDTTDQYVGLCENCRDPPEYEDFEMKYLTFPEKHAVYTFSNKNNTVARLVNFYMAIEALSLSIHVGFPSGNMTYEKNFSEPLHNDKDVIDVYVSNGTYSFSLIRLDLFGPSKPFYSGATIAFVTIETC